MRRAERRALSGGLEAPFIVKALKKRTAYVMKLMNGAILCAINVQRKRIYTQTDRGAEHLLSKWELPPHHCVAAHGCRGRS